MLSLQGEAIFQGSAYCVDYVRARELALAKSHMRRIEILGFGFSHPSKKQL